MTKTDGLLCKSSSEVSVTGEDDRTRGGIAHFAVQLYSSELIS